MPAEDPPTKCYEDKAVQTESSQLVTLDKYQSMEDLDKDISAVAGHPKEERVSATESTKSGALGGPSFCTEGSEDPEDVEGISMAPTTRAYSNDLSYRTLKLPSARIVSLPEALSPYSARRSLLESVAGRIVSNPERSRAQRLDLSQSSDSLDISAETDHIVCGSQVRTRARLRTTAMDAPFTPSPPSSPDSVVIIADKSQLPRGFLRSKVTLEPSASAIRRDEEGWITWTRSPPRPIPALHGPLSLPYARCPSGAEGTIIEEPDNLPRIIWGLEGEESNRQPTSVPSQSAPQNPARATHSVTNQVPPRFQNQPEGVQPPRDSPLKPSTQLARSQTRPLSPPQNLLSEHPDLQRSLPGHGPIDLSNILRPRGSITGYSTRDLYEIPPQDSYKYGLNAGISADWQSLLLQDKFQDQALPNSVTMLADEIGDYLRPSFSASTVSSLASSRSPIVIESAGHLPMINQDTPRRMTALEIAQKYRNDQLQYHQQPALPTPPNSSSPIWTSRHSPHQSSFVSPDLLQRNVLPQGSTGFTHSTSRALRPRAGQTPLDTLHLNPVTPGMYVSERGTYNVGVQERLSRLQASSTLERSTANPIPHLPQYQRDHILVNIPQSRTPNRDRPLASTSTEGGPANDSRRHLPNPGTPVSPTSPNPGLKGTLHQQSRPAPLGYVSQRRLSSVPEEDFAALRDHGRTPSPAVSPTIYRPVKTPVGKPSALGANEDSRKPQNDVTAPPTSLRQVGHSQGAPDMGTRGHQFPAAPSSQTQPLVGTSHGRSRGLNSGPPKGKGESRQLDDQQRPGRGRGKGRGGGKPRRGRGGPPGRGPERVDGGITVRS